jgi:hypothetical protein
VSGLTVQVTHFFTPSHVVASEALADKAWRRANFKFITADDGRSEQPPLEIQTQGGEPWGPLNLGPCNSCMWLLQQRSPSFPPPRHQTAGHTACFPCLSVGTTARTVHDRQADTVVHTRVAGGQKEAASELTAAPLPPKSPTVTDSHLFECCKQIPESVRGSAGPSNLSLFLSCLP